MKKYVYVIASALASFVLLSSCEKPEESEGETLLTAQIQDGGTKVYLDGVTTGSDTDLLWESDDMIVVANSSGNGVVRSNLRSGADTKTATFPVGVPSSKLGTVAFYPAKIVSGISSKVFTVTLPSTQVYTAEDTPFKGGYMPLAGNLSDGNIAFYPLLSAICVGVKNSKVDDLTLSSVTLSSLYHGLCGSTTVTVDGSNSAISAITHNESNGVITLQPGSDLKIVAGATQYFTIAFPPITLTANASKTESLTLTVNFGSGLTPVTMTIGPVWTGGDEVKYEFLKGAAYMLSSVIEIR